MFFGGCYLKVKFRELKTRCRQIVKNFREKRNDDREFPEFFLHALAQDGSKGEVHLYRKARGQEPYISKGTIHYESFAELSVILESLGNAWAATRPSS
jgi:hypothetical protein